MRNLSKVGRQAARSGEAIPEEILAAMPKRMREQVKRDRENAVAMAKRRVRPNSQVDSPRIDDASDGIPIFEDEDGTQPFMPDEPVAVIAESTELRKAMRASSHVVDPDDADMDLDAFFAEVEAEVSPEPPVNPESGVRFRTPTNQAPAMRPLPAPPGSAPSQVARPNPIVPGSSVIHGAVPVESMAGPFARTPIPGRTASDPGARTPVPRASSDVGAKTPVPSRVSSDAGARTPVPSRATDAGARTPVPRASSEPARPVAQYPEPHHARPVAQTPEPQRPVAQYPEPHHAQPRPRAAPPVAASSRPTPDGPRSVAPPARASTPRPAASRPEHPPPQTPPPGMTDADVNALYAELRASQRDGRRKGWPGLLRTSC